MSTHFIRLGCIVAALLASFCTLPCFGQASHVQLIIKDGNFSLLRDGQPFFIMGAGGDASKQMLKDAGGNSFRTWGADNIDDKLAEAQKLGLAVTVGIWLQHEGNGFNYNNADDIAKQVQNVRDNVLKYKDNPAVLMWALGNEMEGYKNGDNAAIWENIEAMAAMVHKLDPNHPIMTVIAEIGGDRIKNIERLCPDIDVVGINSYGGGASLADRYRKLGATKPFVITEFGPAGTWEIGKNPWGVPLESTSTQKADAYRATYEKSVLAEKDKLCLGSYAFAWGAKQEATATWYGIFLADGTRLEAYDTLAELWSGKKPANRCPQIEPLKVEGSDQVNPGDTIRVDLNATDPQNDPMTVKWVLTKDLSQYNTGGETGTTPPTYPEAIVSSDLKSATLKMPKDGGGYWLYAYAYDTHGGAAMANVPLKVNGAEVAPVIKAASGKIPFAVYEDNMPSLPYIWSGWMGNIPAIGMDEKCTDNPHSGATCMKLDDKSAEGFCGIIWQSPANDWGNAPGGFDLTGATKLSIWARGQDGGEKVKFVFGVLGKDKPFHDSDGGETTVELTKDWKEYTIDLTGKDLSCIKTGFGWVVGAQGHPVTFYVDDIRYE